MNLSIDSQNFISRSFALNNKIFNNYSQIDCFYSSKSNDEKEKEKKNKKKIKKSENLIKEKIENKNLKKSKIYLNKIKKKEKNNESSNNKNELLNIDYFKEKSNIKYNSKINLNKKYKKTKNKYSKEEEEEYSQLKTNTKTGNLKTKNSLLYNNNTRAQSGINIKNKNTIGNLMCNEIINESNEIDLSLRNNKSKIGIKLIKKPLKKKINNQLNNNNKNIKEKNKDNNNKNFRNKNKSGNNSLLIPYSCKNLSQNEERKKIKINNGINFGYEYWKENKKRLKQMLLDKYNKKKYLIHSISQPILLSNNEQEYNNNSIIINKGFNNSININNAINNNNFMNKTEFLELIKSPINPYSINWTDRILGKNFGKTIRINGSLNGIPKLEMVNLKFNYNHNLHKNYSKDNKIQNFPSIFQYFKE